VRGRRRSSGIRAAGLALLCACLTSGCVSLQEDGTITKVQEQDAGAAQVQIWPSSPSPRENAGEIVSGFLEAARSGAANQKIAAAYLTQGTQKTWQEKQNKVIVLADYSESSPQEPNAPDQQDGPNEPGSGSSDDDYGAATVVEQVQGTVIGQLDANGLFSAQSRSVAYNFTVKLTKDGYRIAQLPDDFGVLMDSSDFESFYTRHVVYYENPQPEANGKMMVPAQVYLPSVDTEQQVDEQAARLVVDGVPAAPSSVMRDAADGARFVSMQMDSSGRAGVKIKSNGACGRPADGCDLLARLLAQTLGGLSTKFVSVELTDTSSGRTVSAQPTADVSDYGLGPQLRADGTRAYYAISPTGQLEQLNTSGDVLQRSIDFGDSKVTFSSVTEQPGGTDLQDLALVSQDESTLYEPRRQNGVEQLATVYPAAGSPAGGRVGRAGWDYFGNLWFTVVLGKATSVYRYDGRSLDQVEVNGLNAMPEEVLPAPDGDQVAVRYTDGAGQQIAIGAVIRTADDGYALNLVNAQVVASSWKEVTDFDWFNEGSLAVLGIQPGSGELGLYEIYTDGSAAFDSLTSQPSQVIPPSQAGGFVWTAAGPPIVTAPNQGKDTLYTLSVEGQNAQSLNDKLYGSSPTY